MPIMKYAMIAAYATLTTVTGLHASDEAAIDIGSRRELFVDRHLIERTDNIRHGLHPWVDRGSVMTADKPWEGPFCSIFTVLHDSGTYRLYYRGKPQRVKDGTGEVTCYAESTDGITWTKPSLGIHEYEDSTNNNIILRPPDLTRPYESLITHNFSPFLNRRPDADPEQKYLAIAGVRQGLYAYTSADGIHWKKLAENPVITSEAFGFDSHNVAFWSTSENKYVAYVRFRVTTSGEIKDGTQGIRSIARVESDDFINWSAPKLMSYTDTQSVVPSCHLYINNTQPYFRAPHIYVSTASRFMPSRQVLTTQQAQAIGADPKYFGDTSDSVLMSSRGGYTYDRSFLGALIPPGIGAENWVSRANYPALNIVQTGPTEMSLYVAQNYAQPTLHLRRYTNRLDGLASFRAEYDGGELVTKPLKFSGSKLLLNFATSAAGGIRVEVQDATGAPLPGFALEDCRELIGNEIERAVEWRGGDVSQLSGQPIRLRFVLKDAELFAIRFANAKFDN